MRCLSFSSELISCYFRKLFTNSNSFSYLFSKTRELSKNLILHWRIGRLPLWPLWMKIGQLKNSLRVVESSFLEREFHCFTVLEISHFRVPLCLCFKAHLRAKPFSWKQLDLHENETAWRTHLHMKGFALRLVLKQREMAYSEFDGI